MLDFVKNVKNCLELPAKKEGYVRNVNVERNKVELIKTGRKSNKTHFYIKYITKHTYYLMTTRIKSWRM